MRTMQAGGLWNDRPRGFIDVQIDRQIAAGHDPDAAARFALAMAFGGVTEHEAFEIIRDRDCAHKGTAHEKISPHNLPSRWFRDAWRRSHNGGPVMIDLEAARQIQFARLRQAVAMENEKRSEDLYKYNDPIEPDWGSLADRIRAADDETVIRRVWIEGVA